MCVGQILHDCVRGRDRVLHVHDPHALLHARDPHVLLHVHDLHVRLRVHDRDHGLHLHVRGRDPRGLLLSDQVPH